MSLCKILCMKDCSFLKKEINNVMVSEDTDGGPESVPPSSCFLNSSILNLNICVLEGFTLRDRRRFLSQ